MFVTTMRKSRLTGCFAISWVLGIKDMRFPTTNRGEIQMLRTPTPLRNQSSRLCESPPMGRCYFSLPKSTIRALIGATEMEGESWSNLGGRIAPWLDPVSHGEWFDSNKRAFARIISN